MLVVNTCLPLKPSAINHGCHRISPKNVNKFCHTCRVAKNDKLGDAGQYGTENKFIAINYRQIFLVGLQAFCHTLENFTNYWQ